MKIYEHCPGNYRDHTKACISGLNREVYLIDLRRAFVKVFLIFISSFFFIQNSFSQDFSDKNETISAMKISFLTQKLNLTPREAQVFWPVYNQYEDELESVRKTHRKLINETKDDFSQISDADM